MEIKKVERDEDLDIIRAIAIIWVIAIHCMFWLGLFSSPTQQIIKSLFLIEMPLFFFVAGASNFLSVNKGLCEFWYKRIKRIIVPYWAYALISLVLIIDQSGHKPGLVLSWLNPFYGAISGEGKLQYLTWALWFIPVYLLCMFFYPILKKYYLAFDKHKTIQILPLILLVFLLVMKEFYGWVIPQYRVILYLVFTYLGMYYNTLRNKKIIKVAGAVVFGGIAFVFWKLGLYSINMLVNKDSANLMFLTYGLFAISIFFLAYPKIKKLILCFERWSIFSTIFNQYKKSGYTIYLFHPLAFAAIPFILDYFGVYYYFPKVPSVILASIYFVLVIIISAFIGKILGKIEKI